MSRVPPEMHQQVLDLACQITNAVLADDAALAEAHYLSLIEYYRAKSEAGLGHPFLTETVADYTDDPEAAASYYQLALAQAQQIGPTEPTQTILLGLADQLMALGQRETAEACWRAGHSEARRRNDAFALEEADWLEKAWAAQTPPSPRSRA